VDAGTQEELGRLLRGEVSAGVPLRERTTYRIGGEARLLACPADLEDLRRLNAYLVERNLPSFVLGGGANLLVSDRGFSGVAVHLGRFNRLSLQQGSVRAGAGLVLDEFIKTCLRRGLAGLECLSDIPGSLGGALRMNAGAFGAEISDHLVEVECLDGQGRFKVLKKDEVKFSYREALRIRETYIPAPPSAFPRVARNRSFSFARISWLGGDSASPGSMRLPAACSSDLRGTMPESSSRMRVLREKCSVGRRSRPSMLES